MAHKVLLVDDDDAVRRPVRRFLERSGFDVREAATAEGASTAFYAERPDAVLLDFALPDGTALDVLPALKSAAPDVPVVILTGHGTIERAVQCLKEGATDFLTKPIELSDLADLLFQALAERDPRGSSREIDPFVGGSGAVRELANEAKLALRSESPALLQGETGSGKGVLARWIHTHGGRAEGPLVRLNCGGLAKDLLESELFGHTRGAFTGAVRDKVGLLDAANGGTLFLDEIGDMDLDLQPKLLTVLDDRSYRRLGEVRERTADIRLITATNRDLGELVRERRFRADLYFRISTLTIRLPPLRERLGDLDDLVDVMLRQLRGPDVPKVAPSALAALRGYDWPGNFRELRSVLERALLAAEGRTLTADDLRFDSLLSSRPDTETRSLAESERRHIEEALDAERGHVTRTADRLGLARSTLYEKLKAFDIDPADFRGTDRARDA